MHPWQAELLVSSQAAREDDRECPWYEPWDILLNHFLFPPPQTRITTSTGEHICTTCPQYALIYDTEEPGENAAEQVPPPQFGTDNNPTDVESASDSEDSQSDAETSSPLTPSSSPIRQQPNSSYRPRFMNDPFSSPSNQAAGAHATGSWRLTAAPSPADQYPASSGLPFPLAPLPANPSTPQNRAIRRSHRIPDFVQILRSVRFEPPHSRPVIIAKRAILIVEIKRLHATKPPWQKLFQGQIRQQAHHAFKNDDQLLVLGAIAAFGNFWTFRDYHCGTASADSELYDSSYIYSPSASDSAPLPRVKISTGGYIPPCFGAAAAQNNPPNKLRILDFDNLPETITAFGVILAHLKAVNAMLWGLEHQFDRPGVCPRCEEELDQQKREEEERKREANNSAHGWGG
ncbi:hypothetical protein BJ138DRAFT_1106297 [Hygrophoropsis aurantiaca]|uniref:Uncharacterized protein n=1 Tax=Hygrophoropsis aurantiaca TaxID=72124 RepID=A0ACB7ZWJ0_9AGAM|nr:hypothetical protein BJ138DRAFT_1106297 [Hygrophoropsis aurantiaca]